MRLLSPVAEVTRSLSNVIKYPFVNLEGKDVYVIDAEAKYAENNLTDAVADENEISAETEQPFIPATNIAGVKKALEEERKQFEIEREQILTSAREQADAIVTQSHKQAEKLHKEAYEAGKIEGFSAGEVNAKEKYREMESELYENMERHEEEYRQMLDDIEPRYVEVVIALVKKLTGILIEDKNDIILYLIKNSIDSLDKSKHYTIRVSKEDAFTVDSKKQELREIVGENTSIEIVEEKNLEKNECIIETDSQMVDCGFQTQLDNLVETLKMLV